MGDSYGFYTASGVTFAPPNGGGSGNGNVTIGNAGANTIGTVTLANSYMINGVYGNVNYTGSLGTVNACQPILVSSFTDSGYSTPNDYLLIDQNNVRYDLCTFNQAPGTTLYLMAAYDASGPCGTGSANAFWTGNWPNHVAVQYLGAYTVGTSTMINITIPDSPPGASANGGC